MLKKYAELLVRKGVNLQENQELVIDASIEHVELVRAITKIAFELKAKDVIVHYHDEVITRLRYENLPVSHFENIPSYLVELRNEYAKRNAAIIMLTGDDPENMKGIDPMKIQTYSSSMHKMCKPFYDSLDLGINRWVIAGAPTLKWAKKVFKDKSDQEAIDALWQAIYKTAYCDLEDPIHKWDEHKVSFENRVNALNQMNIKQLHYTNKLGTDLIVGLNKDYLFAGGGSYTTDGIYSFPNIPTEEIFTSPMYKDVNGIVYNSLPLNYNGNIIDEFYIRFENGKAVDYHANIGNDVLKSIIETDEGSHYLGEIALIPNDSPISNMNLLFYNTLYDENASCHLALGKGFVECIKDGYSLNKEQLKEKGINDSLTHVDFMIGTDDLNIEALLENNDKIMIFSNGNWDF
jgi:aminopeptidase